MAKTKMQCPVGRAMKSAGFKTPKEAESALRRAANRELRELGHRKVAKTRSKRGK